MDEPKWKVSFDKEFKKEEFDKFPQEVQDAILAKAKVLAVVGPDLGRPLVDTLYDSDHTNMKELRCDVDERVWRVAFAFDPERKAILLTAGNKTGVKPRKFYKRLIAIADARFKAHLKKMKGAK